ncbi:MAG: hypothetical protein IJ094_05710 [Bacilli bacterium]|nr:hypothetical protein [Bacilli bacterium]
MQYNRELKKQLCESICINHNSTLKTANEYGIPIKTLEKWITAFNKDNTCFDPIITTVNDFKYINKPDVIDYNDLSNEELKNVIMKKDIEIARLKKGYMVKEGGTGKKVFVTFSKKNMK